MKEWMHSVLDLIYPPLCLHCCHPLTRTARHFCLNCISLLELIDPLQRCPRCFSIDFCQKRRLCGTCSKSPPSFTHMAAAFEHMGPAATLVQKMKYSRQPYLAKGAAAYLAVQFLALQWPLPDLIVPVPISCLRLIERGYNQSLVLADALSALLNKPVLDALKKRSGSYSQAGLSRKLRLTLEQSTFSLKRGTALQDKVILLIDDVATTGSTLNCCARALLEQSPQAVYALTLCRAVK